MFEDSLPITSVILNTENKLYQTVLTFSHKIEQINDLHYMLKNKADSLTSFVLVSHITSFQSRTIDYSKMTRTYSQYLCSQIKFFHLNIDYKVKETWNNTIFKIPDH